MNKVRNTDRCADAYGGKSERRGFGRGGPRCTNKLMKRRRSAHAVVTVVPFAFESAIPAALLQILVTDALGQRGAPVEPFKSQTSGRSTAMRRARVTRKEMYVLAFTLFTVAFNINFGKLKREER